MEWSTDVYLVALLQQYLTPEVSVADFVHEQLITDKQKDELTVAIRQVTKLWRTISTPYDVFLNYTCLDWANEEDVDQIIPMVRRGMFDLMLGDQIRRMLLNQYEEVRNIRSCIEEIGRASCRERV